MWKKSWTENVQFEKKDNYSKNGNASLSQAREINVGVLLHQKIAITSLSQAEKFNVLTNYYKRGTDFAFFEAFMNGCNRSFQRVWLEKYPWHFYGKDGFCLPCIFFSIREKVGALVNTPLTRWTKAGSACGEHEKSRYHEGVPVAYDNFPSSSWNPEKKH